MNDQPLAAQFLAAGGVVALFSVLSLTLLLTQFKRQADATQSLVQIHQTIDQLNTLGRDFYRQQTALHEYLKSKEPLHLASVSEGRQLWSDGIKKVSELLASDESQAETLDLLKENYRAWVQFADHVLNKKSDPSTMKIEAALFKEAFLTIDQMIDSQSQSLLFRNENEKGSLQATFSAIAIINILLLVIVAFVLTRLYLSIARPISNLSHVIHQYQEGEFGARVEVSNCSEFGFLEDSFNRMAEKTESMVADLRKLDEMKSEFVSTTSHELRTPLTSIGGYAKVLLSEDAGPLTDTQKEFLNIIDTNVVRLNHLISDVLDVEILESGNVKLQKEPQDLGAILKECRDTLGIVAAKKGLDLKYKVPEHLNPILGDRSRLVQTFMNILSNAIKYTVHGSIEIQAEEHDFAVVIRIRDTGIGISEEEMERIFDKFYRVQSSLTSGESGTGLGLVIVRGLVEAHGGTISVESAPGKGSVFSVSFPAFCADSVQHYFEDRSEIEKGSQDLTC